ncbi:MULTISPECIES: hypothetical protein [Bifidobacterium]|uniref:Uncharacterized protein n=2 Tax=Bifidobacterium TaxID=1678 RepID=A0A430F9J8_9BIFI|nr:MULTISPECIES: hypothetical protein [Bifidobacterium]OXN00827.1 hypothetical protein Tam10B_0783 [Bifidobacterium vansinderenii]RSX49511.1 hypothetical protein D2E23_2013 [Bifidobacterium callimiconis]
MSFKDSMKKTMALMGAASLTAYNGRTYQQIAESAMSNDER